MADDQVRAVIIGAGIGGLATALRLADAGLKVTVLDAASTPGGKMRTLPSAAGPVDTGPTVLTFRPVFDALFSDVGARLEDHVTLTALPILARHFWRDGTILDLHADHDASRADIEAVFGGKIAAAFDQFAKRAERLLTAFEGPMLHTVAPRQIDLTAQVLRRPSLIADMAPWRSLASDLRRALPDARLAQLFARYATYVGGLPQKVPALLSLIAAGEARGVWAVDGGMQHLAQVIADLAETKGAEFQYDTPARRIVVQNGRPTGVVTDQGQIAADLVVFAGDPRALTQGLLGPASTQAVPDAAVEPRSLSAHVLAFAARPKGPDLSYHNVFFGDDPDAEFAALEQDAQPEDATLYLCAQDRARPTNDGLERFEVIRNAPPLPAQDREKDPCQTLIFDRLRDFGLTFEPLPGPEALTRPTEWNALFPASQGSLYGRRPPGLTGGLNRPPARSTVPGLYLAGGGAHPGAGVPMATLSGQHAAEAILTDLAFTSRSRPTATRGGTLTGSVTAAPVPSASSPS